MTRDQQLIKLAQIATVEEDFLDEKKKNKKKKPYSSISITSGDPKYNIDMFNKIMGSDVQAATDAVGTIAAASPDGSNSVSVEGAGALGETLKLDEAKRYVRRYYIRPQNVFCSNKAEILKVLADGPEQNCSIYTLINLGDEKDVNKLTIDDIIYYYDEGILYDKNHVRVMDYDLGIKREEERTTIKPDQVSEKTFKDVYQDRMTELTDLEEGVVTFGDGTTAKTFGLPQEIRKSLRERAISNAAAVIEAVKNGADLREKRNIYFNMIKGSSASSGDVYLKYYKQYFNDVIDRSGIDREARRVSKIKTSYVALENLTPEETQIAADWLYDHTKAIMFRIPRATDDIATRISDQFLSIEEADRAAAAIELRFKQYYEEFKNLFPNAQKGIDYQFRDTDKEKDTTYVWWNLSGAITFDTLIADAPEPIIKLIEVAQKTARKNKHETKDIEEVKQGQTINSYYFCLNVLKLFNNDFSFYKKDVKTKTESAIDDPFNLEFTDVDAFGQALHEDKATPCCICGEEINGYGNNPVPVKATGKCCDACNIKFVIPARLAELTREDK